jgi:hypothetical protein
MLWVILYSNSNTLTIVLDGMLMIPVIKAPRDMDHSVSCVGEILETAASYICIDYCSPLETFKLQSKQY